MELLDYFCDGFSQSTPEFFVNPIFTPKIFVFTISFPEIFFVWTKTHPVSYFVYILEYAKNTAFHSLFGPSHDK